MLTLSKKLCAGTLGLALLLAASTSADAQSFGGRMSTKEKAAVIGGSAAAGAILGGLLGGKKGAVIGGLLGAGGGSGYVYYKGKQDEDRYGRYGYRDYRYRDYRGFNDQRRYDYRDRSRVWDRRYHNGFRR
ncbi:MAG: flagellar motor protein MotB [Blastocatellia bacterium]